MGECEQFEKGLSKGARKDTGADTGIHPGTDSGTKGTRKDRAMDAGHGHEQGRQLEEQEHGVDVLWRLSAAGSLGIAAGRDRNNANSFGMRWWWEAAKVG